MPVEVFRDAAAARRLRRAIEREYVRQPTDGVTNDSRLASASQVSRQAIIDWTQTGVQPKAAGIEAIARALGVDPRRLWSAWLDLPLPNDALERIAAALERAYPVSYRADPLDPVAEAEVAERTLEAARALRPRAGSESPSKRSAPRDSTG